MAEVFESGKVDDYFNRDMINMIGGLREPIRLYLIHDRARMEVPEDFYLSTHYYLFNNLKKIVWQNNSLLDFTENNTKIFVGISKIPMSSYDSRQENLSKINIQVNYLEKTPVFESLEGFSVREKEDQSEVLFDLLHSNIAWPVYHQLLARIAKAFTAEHLKIIAENVDHKNQIGKDLIRYLIKAESDYNSE